MLLGSRGFGPPAAAALVGASAFDLEAVEAAPGLG